MLELLENEYLVQMLTIGLLQIVALLSPGPDFALIVRNSARYSRKTAVMTGFGIGCGEIVHVGYTVLGLAYIISETVWLFEIMKYAGAAYLFYLGYQSFKSTGATINADGGVKIPDISPYKAFFQGFLNSGLNPKAMLFFLSLFTVVVDPETPTMVILAYGVELTILSIIYFVALGFCLSSSVVKGWFNKISKAVDRLTGGAMIALGIKLVLTSAK